MLGLAKSCVGGMKWYVSVPETIIIGAISASAAFGIGKAFGGQGWHYDHRLLNIN